MSNADTVHDHKRERRTTAKPGGDGDARQRESLPELVEDAFGHAAGMVRDEVRLARAELLDGIRTIQGGALSAALGAVLLIPGLTLVLYAAAFGMATAGWVPAWAGALIVGAIATIIGLAMIMTGKSKIDPSQLSTPRAKQEAERTADLAKEKLQ